ncbi:putative phospholipid-transporting ATPase 9 [Camellia lanceoleosa]|uniref:Phospholipid-transporting ATPase 9 n=1 Tax=Camellia lanceoleosa TaxID=1840588 RepID=A0ACC0FC24_9ERIC|nr:putative phospholipid-transporting ATPase 9 [Camellia lanceoleosa]
MFFQSQCTRLSLKRDLESKIICCLKEKTAFEQNPFYFIWKPSFNGEHSQIGGPGFSRVVFCNDPECLEATSLKNGTNYVRTTKFTFATFVPKALFEQFRRVANVYFLICAILSFTPFSPYSAVSTVLPFVLVVGVTMGKELLEDWRRKMQDIEVNNRTVKVHHGDGIFDHTKWMNLRVGDVVKVEKDEFFPADIILLSSSYDEALCYVETTNLDGETNLKLKQALEVTSPLNEDSRFQNFKAVIRCEDPNANLYSFVGSLEIEEQQFPLTIQQLLLRGSKLKNTDYIYGVVIFTGHDLKVMQNPTAPPSKRSRIEKRTDKLVYLLFSVLVLMSFIGSIFFGIATREDLQNGLMTRCDCSNFAILTALMLYSYLIPISLYVSIEIVKVLQSVFINHDLHMYYEEGDKPANGTLTCNSMEFIKCSVAGAAYGRGVTEVERALAQTKGSPLAQEPSVKGFNFVDERIMNGNWVNEPRSDVIQKFFRLLAVCHTAIPEVDEETGSFVIAARELGFEFFERSQTSISLHEIDPISGRKVERLYKLLNVLEFSSSRKRMSVIIRDYEGKLLLLCKGADSVIFERLAKNGGEFEEQTKQHINEYADAGLRTLVLAYRELDEDEYNEFNEAYTEAKNLVSADREEIIESVAEKIEKDLILLGATAVEDKLQHGASKASVLNQIIVGKELLTASSESYDALALIIDGKSLTYALDDDVKDLFMDLAIGCASVICCRSSPKQKALSLVKVRTGKTTLAVGDGANDVGMLQEADIGVGISGFEGMQAVMSSDIAIAQFRFLERLLLVHGHWSDDNVFSLLFCRYATFLQEHCIWFHSFLLEVYASFSGQAAYNDWYLSFYNVFFTSLPVIALGVFDQDISAQCCLKAIPSFVPEGIQNVLFSWLRIFSWALSGAFSATCIFFFCIYSMEDQAFRKRREVVSLEILSTTMYTCVVLVVNCQMALSINYFTYIQHLFIWGSIAFLVLVSLGIWGYVSHNINNRLHGFH